MSRIPIYLCIVATTKCNLHCPHCNQKAVMEEHGDYEMSIEELEHIIESCQERDLHFYAVEFTGGEPSLWNHLEEGLKKIKESKITDNVTLITNGNDAQRISDLATKYCDWYCVSVPQATPNQLSIHRGSGLIPLWNPEVHRPPPLSPIDETIPANCVVVTTRSEKPIRHLMYIKGRVYNCCMTAALQRLTKPDPKLVCDFEENFFIQFMDRKFEHEICKLCVCNSKVWSEI